jgi:hypothetical protein
MIKYILTSKRSYPYSSENPADILKKLNQLESWGTDLSDYFVMRVDTELMPPKTQTAKEFLRSIRGQGE